MIEENDKQFVERMRKIFGERIGFGFSMEDDDRLLSLALRGAETQWRPIEEATPNSGPWLLKWEYGTDVTDLRADDGKFFKNDWEVFVPATHFIPLTALGSPKDE